MPQLVAVSSTARDIQSLLRCVSFAPRALVQISEQGLRFNVEEAKVMQGELRYSLSIIIRSNTPSRSRCP